MPIVEKESLNTEFSNSQLSEAFSAEMRRIADQIEQEPSRLSPERLSYLRLTHDDLDWIRTAYGEKILALSLAIRPHMLNHSITEVAWEAYSRHAALSNTFDHDPQSNSMASKGTFGSLMQFFGGSRH